MIKIQLTTIGPFVKTCFTSSLGISLEIYNGSYALSTPVSWYVFYVWLLPHYTAICFWKRYLWPNVAFDENKRCLRKIRDFDNSKKTILYGIPIPKEYKIQNIFQRLWAIRLFVLFICASGCVCSLCKILILFPSHDMRFSLGIC